MRGQSREHVTLRRITEYDPFSDRADRLGMVTSWAAFNSYGNSVAWGNTKADCARDARRSGYIPEV